MRLIDADDLKYGIINKGQSSRRYKLGEIWELNFTEICEVIDEMPTAIEVEKDNDQNYEYHLEYCPFCGNEVKIETESWGHTSEGHNHSVVIQCVHCRFSFPDKPITIRANWDASELKYVNDMTEFNKAVELWNKRADMREDNDE